MTDSAGWQQQYWNPPPPVTVELAPASSKPTCWTPPAASPGIFDRVPLGEKGRMELKAAIRQAIKDRPELREKVNSVAKLRCATIPQLLEIATICDLWQRALEISRRFVESRNGKARQKQPPRISCSASGQQLVMPATSAAPVKVLKVHKPTTDVFTPPTEVVPPDLTTPQWEESPPSSWSYEEDGGAFFADQSSLLLDTTPLLFY